MDVETLKQQLRSIVINKFYKSSTYRSWEIDQLNNPQLLFYLITIASLLSNDSVGETTFSVVMQMSLECGIRVVDTPPIGATDASPTVQ